MRVRCSDLPVTYAEVRDKMQAVKMASGCVDCGFNEHPEALDFDHLPGTIKIAAVSQLVNRSRSWQRVQAEIAKCEVVCRNCHAIRTAKRRADLRKVEISSGIM